MATLDLKGIAAPQVISYSFGQGLAGTIRLNGTTSPAAYTLAGYLTDEAGVVKANPVPAAVGSTYPNAIDVPITAAITAALDKGTYLVWVRRTDVGFEDLLALLKIEIYIPPWRL